MCPPPSTVYEKKPIRIRVNQSDQNTTSILDQTLPRNDHETRICNLEEELRTKNGLIQNLQTEMTGVKKVNQDLAADNKLLNEKIETLSRTGEERLSDVEIKVDDVEAYTSRNILKVDGIPIQGTYKKPENCYEIVKNFCGYYLNIKVQTYDICIAHRQFNPKEKRRHGKNYIPSIYVKFVNRFLADEIFRKQYLLKNVRNKLGGSFSIERRMTLKRKQLLESAKEKLTSFKFVWSKNGNVFAKKDKWSKKVKITSEAIIDGLIHDQGKVNVTVDQLVEPLHAELATASIPSHAEPAIAPKPPHADSSPSSALPHQVVEETAHSVGLLQPSQFPAMSPASPGLLPSQHFPPQPRSPMPVSMSNAASSSGSYANITTPNSNRPRLPYLYPYQSRMSTFNQNSLMNPSEMMLFNRSLYDRPIRSYSYDGTYENSCPLRVRISFIDFIISF